MANTLPRTTRFFCLLFLLAFITLSFQQAMAEGAPGVRLKDIVIEVIEADLDIASVPAINPVYVPEDHEVKIGGYVPLNRGDDDGNGTPDLDDSGETNGEDDLLVIKLKTWLPRQDIPVTLAATKGGEKIRIWTEPQRTIEIAPLPFTWKGEEAAVSWLTGRSGGDIVPIPSRLYVEGIKASDSLGDVVLKLCVGNCSPIVSIDFWGGPSARNEDSVALTVVDFDISIPDLESGEKGDDIHIGYNDDDDDIDNKVDLDNASRPNKDENDTRAIEVTVKPSLEGRAEVRLTVAPGIKLWRSEHVDELFLGSISKQVTKKLDKEDQNKTFYAEGVNLKPVPAEISLEVDFGGKIGIWKDKIDLAVARADISIADFKDSGEREYFEGGYVAKSKTSPPDEKDLTALLLSADVSAGKFGNKTCIDLEIKKGINNIRLFTKEGGTLERLNVVNCPDGGYTYKTLPEQIYVQGLNTTGPRGIELWLHFRQKTTTGRSGIVHSDRISLTVLKEPLWILPQIVFIPDKGGKRDLNVILNRPSSPVDVTAHEGTEYHWIGKTYPDLPLKERVWREVLQAGAKVVFDNALIAFNDAAKKVYGESAGLKRIKNIKVNKGKLKADEPGMQLVWATHNGVLTDNATIVFVGLVLDTIQLEPMEYIPPFSLSHMLTDIFGLLKSENVPLVLSVDKNYILADKGQIFLHEMTFRLLDKGPKVPLGSLAVAMTEIARTFSLITLDLSSRLVSAVLPLTPLAPLAPVVAVATPIARFTAWIGSHVASFATRKGMKYIATNFVTYESSDKSIASVTNFAVLPPPLGGFVQSGDSGWTGIKGTLDLGWLGKASDTVITWVLPELETVDIETSGDPPGNHTAPILIDTQRPAKPGPPVRAFARTNVTKASEIEFDKKAAEKSLKAAGTILPNFLLTRGPITFKYPVDLSRIIPGLNFRIEITGTIGLADKGPKKAAIQFRNFKIGFHVPNNIFLIDKLLLSNDWWIKDPSIVRIDPNNKRWLDVHILHQGLDQTGKTEISTIVALAGMGSATGTRPVETRKDELEITPPTTRPGETRKDELEITPPTATIVLGVTPDDMAQYKATRKYVDGREKDVSDRAIWSGSNKMIARLERGGRAIGLSPGEITLQATEGGLTSNQAELIVAELIVKHVPLSCVVVPSEAQARIGETGTFTVVATFSSGATGSVTSGVDWVSGKPTVATVVDGEATAKAEGETDIIATFAEIKCTPAKFEVISQDSIGDPSKLTTRFDHAAAAVALGDLDGNGDLDAFVANFGDPNIVWLNNGDGSFTWSGERLGDGLSTAVALGDLDGDGDLDAYVTNFNQNDRIWLNDGKGHFKIARKKYDSVRIESAKEPLVLDQGRGRGVALGDIDMDGDLDVFIARDGQPDRVWLNTGINAELREDKTAIEELASDSMDVALGDIDQDGDLDAVVVTDHGEPNKLWLNQAGRFSRAEHGPGKGISRAVVLADLDGDDDDDAFVVNAAGDGHEIWLNLAGEQFDLGQRLASLDGVDVDVGDLDGDGDLDVYVVSESRGNRIWLNDGTGTFEVSKEDFGRAKSTGVALGDLDGDGDLDAFIVNDGEPDYVWLNEDFGKPRR